MAHMPRTITIKIDTFLTDTRVIRCLSTDCAYNQAHRKDAPSIDCMLKVIEIGEDGICNTYQKDVLPPWEKPTK